MELFRDCEGGPRKLRSAGPCRPGWKPECDGGAEEEEEEGGSVCDEVGVDELGGWRELSDD